MSTLMENEEGRAEGIGAPAGALEKTVAFDFDKVEDTAAKASDMPSKHNPDALNAHATAGHDLIPINGKRPTSSGWTTSPALPLDKAKARMIDGKNVGVRLRDIDLVVDVDPRHFAANDDPLARLCIDFGLPDAPFVLTGGGGRHLYFRKPASAEVAGKLATYDGIDFKSKGGQVVAAGSVHPDTARSYRLDDDALALSLSEAPEAPTAFLDAIAKRSAVASADVGAIDEEKLAEWLSHIDVLEFRDELRWRELMMACHHATGGFAVEAFVDWSTADPDYAEHGEIIRRRWNSLVAKRGAITARTLIAALARVMRREAIESLGRVAAEDDFPEDVEGESSTPLANVWDGWVFVAEAMQFIRREDGRKYRTDQWKALYGGLYPDGEILGAVWKARIPIRKFEALVYLPEAPEFPDGENGGRYNIWRKSGVDARLGDVKPFLEHMAFLFPDEGDRGLVFDYLALLTQKPADKIHFALLVRGSQGTGKSWIGNLMERIVGRPNTVRRRTTRSSRSGLAGWKARSWRSSRN